MRRFLARALATATAVGVLMTGGLFIGGPAMAGPYCPSGHHCVFRDYLGDPDRFNFAIQDPNFSNNYFYGTNVSVNDRVSAASNSTTANYRSHYFLHANYVDFMFCVNPGSKTQPLPSHWNDKASSLWLQQGASGQCY